MASDGTSVSGVDDEDGGVIAFLTTGVPVVGCCPDGSFDVILTTPVEGFDTVGEVTVEADFSDLPHAAWSSNGAVIPRAEGALWNFGQVESDLGLELPERAEHELEIGNRCEIIAVGEEC